MGIQPTPKTQVVPLECGGKAFVRRARSSNKNDIATAAGLTTDVASTYRLVELICRWAVIGAEDLVDTEIGEEPIKFTVHKHPLLGVIASRDVFDALTTADCEAIMKACGGDSTVEVPTGNS